MVEPCPMKKRPPHNSTVAELMVRFMEERVIPYYVDPVTKEPTVEQGNFRAALTPMKRLYEDLPANEFNPQHLHAVRQSMIDGSWMTEAEKKKWTQAGRKIGLTRTTVNERIGRIKMMFRWAAEMMIAPAAVFHTLATVAGLRRGRSAAREGMPVKPIAIGAVEATLPYLGPVVRDIVELLLLTGMRVGEAVIMRATDIDMGGPVWLYKPETHKNAWRGHQRVVAIGPRAQEIIRKHLSTKLDALLFSPAAQAEMIAVEKRARRKTKVQPSQVCRKKAKPKKKPGEQFGKDAINHAIRAACTKADIPRWHTHQLRHTAALEISRQHGLEAARAVLGHPTVQMSAHYSGLDQATAAEVMGKIG
jgi:integrase